MDQLGHQIFQFLHQHGYWIMLPLMIAEGPIVTIISATMSALGAFNVIPVFIFSVLGDVIGDIIFYYLGYFGGMTFVKRFGKYLGMTEKLILKMEGYFQRYGGRTIFLAKSTTGLCWATFTAAGIVKMDFKKFLKNSLLGGLVWSGFLVAMGYFYGYLWKEIVHSIKWIGWVMLILAALTFVAVTIYKKKKTRDVFKNNGENKR